MQIKNTAPKRGMPRENAVIEVVLALCEKCGYDEKNVVLLHIGGDRKFKFPRRGIKLIKPHAFTVEMYIGCGDETVQTNFELKNGGGRAVSGENLFQAMETAFGGRMFLVENKNQEKHSVESSATGHDVVVGENLTVQLLDKKPVSDSASPVGTQIQPVLFEGNQNENYRGYFKDENNVHTAVLALVAKFEVNVPFGFDQFTQTLSDEVGIILAPKAMIPMVQVFTNRGYMVRLNPGVSPARYAITDEAMKFAETNMLLKKTGKINTETSLPEKSVSSVSIPLVPMQNITNVLSGLKKDEAEYQRFLIEVKQLEVELSQFKTEDLESEERNLQGEVQSLNARLEIINARLTEIGRGKVLQEEKKNKITELLNSSRHEMLVSSHNDYERYRKLLLGETS